jgi:hypothetical protein
VQVSKELKQGQLNAGFFVPELLASVAVTIQK